jgi:hypothetical protein
LMPYRVILRSLGGRDFEELCKTVFERLGYRNVKLGPGRGDLGADIIMESPRHEKIVVQCKHHLGKGIGRSAIDELYATAKRFNADVGMLVTTGYFTESAKKCALDLHDVRLELIDLKDFKRLAERAGYIVYDGLGLPQLLWRRYRVTESRIDDYVDTTSLQQKIQTSVTPPWLRMAMIAGIAAAVLIVMLAAPLVMVAAILFAVAVMSSRRKHRRKTKPNSWWSWW